MAYYPHVHCMMTAGGLSLDGDRWVPSRADYPFPKRVLDMMFRGRFLQGLIDALVDAHELKVPGEGSADTSVGSSTSIRPTDGGGAHHPVPGSLRQAHRAL